MQDKPFCVYNATNESFLSLGITFGGSFTTWLKEWLGRAPRNDKEGRWMTTVGSIWTLGLVGSRDLVYLDSTLTVLSTEEAFPALRFAPARPATMSILELPASSVALSQTKAGDRLVICAADEMEFQLRRLPRRTAKSDADAESESDLNGRLIETRRGGPRVRWPRLAAYDAVGNTKGMHGVRDISASGLYLLTEERWAVGSRLRMTLQRAHPAEGQNRTSDHSMMPIRVDLRVARWGQDGMGLEFTRMDAQKNALVAMHAR